MRGTGAAVGSEATVELTPEGPQRDELADDLAAALAATPARSVQAVTAEVCGP